jgi:hypothetical protein
MQLSKRLADCGLARRILTAHVAARSCWWSACLCLGIMSVPRTGLVAWPLNSSPTCKNNGRHNATRYGKLAAYCDASYRYGRGSCSQSLGMGPGQQATTPTHARIATDNWLPLWSVNVAHRPGSDSRNHWIGAKRPTRDFIVGREQASQGAPKEMRCCFNLTADDKRRTTQDGNKAGRCCILVVKVPDVVQRYKNRGCGNSPTPSTEYLRSSKPNGGRSISRISRAKGEQKFAHAASCQVPVQEQAIRGRH